MCEEIEFNTICIFGITCICHLLPNGEIRIRVRELKNRIDETNRQLERKIRTGF